jgi:Tat protein translocase TatB subunit
MFGTLGGPELFLIFVVALIVFGPRKLPEIGKSLGKMMGEFRRASNEFRSTIENEVEAEKIRDSMRIEPPKVDPVSPPATGSTDEPAVTDTPGGPASAPEPEPPPAAETVPETESREPANTPIEPK